MTTATALSLNNGLKLPKNHPLKNLPVPCPLEKSFVDANEIFLSYGKFDANASVELIKRINKEKKEEKTVGIIKKNVDPNTSVKLIKQININKEKKEEKTELEIIQKNMNPNAFSCLCGGELKLGKFNKQKKCSHCAEQLNIGSKAYRCNNGKTSAHKEGFYICPKCGDHMQNGQSLIKSNNYSIVNFKAATHWFWYLIGGKYKSNSSNSDKRLFYKGMEQNLDRVATYISENTNEKYNALYRRLFDPESLSKKDVLTYFKGLLWNCYKISHKHNNKLCGAVIYYCGHGGEETGDWSLNKGKISFEDIYDIILKFRFLWKHLRLVFIIDCCYAGAWCKKLESMYDVYPSTKQIVMMAAADETTKFNGKGGYFTRYVLEVDGKLPDDAPVPYYCVYQSKTTAFHKTTEVARWKQRSVAKHT